ncbi:MAG: hypothetical protein QXV69_05090 [Sulfolobaceae archaeon]
MVTINLKLRAIRAIYKLSKQRVEVIEDWGPVEFCESSISLVRGSEDELPNWLALELEKRGIVKKLSELTLEELGRILFQERENINKPAVLAKIPKDFYMKIKEQLKELSRDSNKGLEVLDQIRKTRSRAEEIISIRLQKIIRLALLETNDQSFISNMTEEELLIYYSIKDLIRSIYGEIFGISAT